MKWQAVTIAPRKNGATVQPRSMIHASEKHSAKVCVAASQLDRNSQLVPELAYIKDVVGASAHPFATHFVSQIFASISNSNGSMWKAYS